jgi:hypothetical protein
MSKKRVQLTDVDNLVSNLRSEVGEVIVTWVLLRELMLMSQELRSGDIQKDLENHRLTRLHLMTEKFSDEIVARLSELAYKKTGRINYFFASTKLHALQKEVSAFEKFVISNKFREKRNKFISHKELPAKWEDHRAAPTIAYSTIVHAIAKAVRLMKNIDCIHLGPRAKYLWMEMRKRRYQIEMQGKASYLLLPCLRLSNEIRVKVALEEQKLGKNVWVDIETKINGKSTVVKACKEWGLVILGNRIMALPQYPLISLEDISFS